MIIKIAELTIEEIEELQKSPLCLNCNHREIFHDNEIYNYCLIPVCQCEEFIKEGDYSNWNISRYDPIFNDSVSKTLQDKIIQQLNSLHCSWRENQTKEALESEPKTIRIKTYDKFKIKE